MDNTVYNFPKLGFAVFDKFGKSADLRVEAHGWVCFEQVRLQENKNKTEKEKNKCPTPS